MRTVVSILCRLQRDTVRNERRISEAAAEAQEAVAATEIVQLLESQDQDGQMESAMRGKKEGMRGVLREADRLRLNTLKGIVDALEPIQAVHFLIAAAQLHLAVHRYGTEKDRLVADGVA